MAQKGYYSMLLEIMLKGGATLEMLFPCPVQTPENEFYKNLYSFTVYCEQAWNFIYKNKIPLFNKESRTFVDRDAFAAHILDDGKRAAEDFDTMDWAHTSLEQINVLIDQYQKLVRNPRCLYPPNEYWEVISKLLKPVFLMVLKKIVEDVTPSVIADIKHLDCICKATAP